jgi:hypothetical protein
MDGKIDTTWLFNITNRPKYGGRRDGYHMVVGFTTTYAIGAYHY